jgi:hypothetical protein
MPPGRSTPVSLASQLARPAQLCVRTLGFADCCSPPRAPTARCTCSACLHSGTVAPAGTSHRLIRPWRFSNSSSPPPQTPLPARHCEVRHSGAGPTATELVSHFSSFIWTCRRVNCKILQVALDSSVPNDSTPASAPIVQLWARRRSAVSLLRRCCSCGRVLRYVSRLGRTNSGATHIGSVEHATPRWVVSRDDLDRRACPSARRDDATTRMRREIIDGSAESLSVEHGGLADARFSPHV